MPSVSKALALASRLMTLRVVPSVPKRPQTVVTPAMVICESMSSGVRVW